MPDDAVELVKLRNDFYRDNHRTLVLLLIISLIIILILGLGFLYIIKNPPQPRYFATTADGRIVPLIPLDQPNISRAALLQWANEAAVAVYTYNFIDYRQSLQSASEYFTPEGWQSFMNALEASNNLNAVLSKKLIVTAVATGAPVILAEGILQGRYAWKVQMPLLVTYQSASQFSQQNLLVTLLIIRISTLQSVRGIAISQFIAAPGPAMAGTTAGGP